jgi:hypothetical protein
MSKNNSFKMNKKKIKHYKKLINEGYFIQKKKIKTLEYIDFDLISQLLIFILKDEKSEKDYQNILSDLEYDILLNYLKYFQIGLIIQDVILFYFNI